MLKNADRVYLGIPHVSASAAKIRESLLPADVPTPRKECGVDGWINRGELRSASRAIRDTCHVNFNIVDVRGVYLVALNSVALNSDSPFLLCALKRCL